MTSFPPNFKIHKFDKYKGKGDPRDHIKEFFMACQEVSYNDVYLLKLFPQSLTGQALDWFTHLTPSTVNTFPDLAGKFVAHLSYNVKHDLTMLDLCNAKQRNGESFTAYFEFKYY